MERDPLSPGPRPSALGPRVCIVKLWDELQAFHVCGLFPLQGVLFFGGSSLNGPDDSGAVEHELRTLSRQYPLHECA